MKRKTLTTAVLAGLTGVAGMVGVSNAVNLNPDGLGQVLLYPYYTARGGNDTLISVVNTTENAKSVKIRFLEGRNSREVLDFNIYMSAYDVWTGAVTESGDGAALIIRDKTCTVPYFVGAAPSGVATVPFSNVEFIDFNGLTPQKIDGAGTGLERTRSGYIEMIEIGTLVDLTEDSATAATHVNGVPADCAQLVTAWTRPQAGGTPVPANYWTIDRLVDHEAPSGGLFGGASIINVNEGTLLSYNAEAIDNWGDLITHTAPEFVTPRIIDGNNNVSAVFISGAQQVDTRPWLTNRDAVNAILMNNQIMNEYVVSPNTDGLTEWVLTHPTKRFSVDPQIIGAASPAIPPFSVRFNSQEGRPGTSCEPITFRLWDREEVELADDPIGVIPPLPSPQPPTPPQTPDTFDLCFEANVVRFLRVDATDPANIVLPGDNGAVTAVSPGATEILGEVNFTTLFMPPNFISGWTKFNFDPEEITIAFPATARRISSLDGVDYVGLPTIGFQASTIANNTLVVDGNAVLSNYGGTFKHRGSRRIEATPTAPPTQP